MEPGHGPSGPFDHTTFESSLAHVESVLDTSPVVIFSAVVEGESMRPFWVSSNVRSVIGYTTGEALAPGWWWSNVHPDDRAEASRSAVGLVMRGHYSHEYRFRHANGAYIWMLDQMKLITRDGDQTVVGSWTNVSTNRQEREQLHAAERHYRRLVQTSPYGIYAIDLEGRFTEVNAAGARILGRPNLLGTSSAVS